MALDIKVACDEIESVSATGSRYEGPLEVSLADARIAEAIDAKDIIGEYGPDSLLENMDFDEVVAFVRNNGYVVEEE